MENQDLMISEQDLARIPTERLNPLMRLMAANDLAKSLSFSTERKYLSASNSQLRLVAEDILTGTYPAHWIKISQVGKPLNEKTEDCFSAIQKILSSCSFPGQTQLLFLLKCENGTSSLHLGVRPLTKDALPIDFANSLTGFIKGMWPGVEAEESDKDDTDFLSDNFSERSEHRYRCINAITGIPSMESQYEDLYPATIDKLIAGSHGKNFSYLVVANPIDSAEIDQILYQCRELNGQAESLKSFNYSENEGSSIAKADTSNSNVTKKDFSTKGATWLAGLGGGAAIVGTIMSFIPETGLAGMGIAGLGGLATSFIPQKTEGTSHSETFTESQAKTISNNVVSKHVEAISEHLFYHSKRFETGKAIGMWSVGAYLLGTDEDDLLSVSMQMSSILSGQESIFEPIRIHDISRVENLRKDVSFGKMKVPQIQVRCKDTVIPHPFGPLFTNLNTLLTTKELSYLINFPLRSVPGISVVESSPEFSLNKQVSSTEESADFGKLIYGGSQTNIKYHLPHGLLSRHSLLSGINGSGKTNTVQAILNSISGKIPFLIIEPAKTEYVDWALEYNRNHKANPIDIYIPGCKNYKHGTLVPKKLRLNPFELVWLSDDQDPHVLTHIDRLKSTFAAAFPMYDILPVLMEDLIYTIYQNKSTDWLSTEPTFGVTVPPTLNSMSLSVDKVINNRQYEEHIERNMKACLNTRIDSLKRGWKGEMLNCKYSTPWSSLFEKPCIINLSYVGDDIDKSFLMALILQFLYEYRSAQAESGEVDYNSNDCRHLTVIEEAHRVMMKCDNPELPQFKSAMMFSNMLSEIRAYGEGMFLVDQVPTRLIPDAIKNTNLKLTHRLVSEDDCKAIAESMGLNDQQKKILSKLKTGQCIASSPDSTDIHWVQVNKIK